MTREDPLAGIDIEGPIQLEVFVLTLTRDGLALTGPCGAAPWYIETIPSDHPVDVVSRLVAAAVGAPELVHSTSWRHGPSGVIISFFAVVDSSVADRFATQVVLRHELARSGPVTAPSRIDTHAVIEHAVRHLAWLAQEDEAVRSRLSEGWLAALGDYVPEPFRNLG